MSPVWARYTVLEYCPLPPGFWLLGGCTEPWLEIAAWKTGMGTGILCVTGSGLHFGVLQQTSFVSGTRVHDGWSKG